MNNDAEPSRTGEATQNCDPLEPKRVKYPATVQLAGIAWLFVAAGYLLFTALALLSTIDFEKRGFLPRTQGKAQARPVPSEPMTTPAQQVQNRTNILMALYSVTFVTGLIATGFAVAGVQALSGATSGVTGKGVGAILMGVLLMFVSASLGMLAKMDSLCLSSLVAFGSMAGGVLAVIGGPQYKRWRKRKSEVAKIKRPTAVVSSKMAPEEGGSSVHEPDHPN